MGGGELNANDCIVHLPTNKHTTDTMTPQLERLNAVVEDEQPVNEKVGYFCVIQAVAEEEQPVNEKVGYFCTVM